MSYPTHFVPNELWGMILDWRWRFMCRELYEKKVYRMDNQRRKLMTELHSCLTPYPPFDENMCNCDSGRFHILQVLMIRDE